MQNSHSFKSYTLDTTQVAGFKATQQNLEYEAGQARAKTAGSFDASVKSSYRSMSNDNSKILESKI